MTDPKELLEKKEILKRYRQLLKVCKSNLEKGDKELIRNAFNLALEAHKDMRRKSGEPYIYHPLAVAQICAEEIGLGPTSIVCALLHDVVEDTYITLDNIKMKFGSKIATIVDGLTKISTSVYDSTTGSVQAENFRKMLLTLSDDVRVILIKLADRLHNMRTLESMSRNSQLKIASETLYIYAPLAHRLGLYLIKTELEDLSVKYTETKEYKLISEKLSETKLERNKFVKSFIEPINAKLVNANLKFDIKGRPKSIYSIMKKMKKQNIPFEEVYDLFAIRIILDSTWEDEKSDCFKAYGIVTDMYTPNPERFRDWISTPKANGYESLHTTVMSPEGKWVEVQIRTQRMDDIAEKGYAAHWKYKEQQAAAKNPKLLDKTGKYGQTNTDQQSGLDQWLASVREMLENPESNAIDFLDDFKQNFFAEEVFVFTPKGELRKMPNNSSALDFAYEIHSDVGNKCIGAKVNNKLVPLSHKLVNGDQVEILT
ncbi:MAG: bifunctional (p)ppGpp synthetase/guanosine-3',5'-bis(diphosphate) 3'-pyrophosphohydrolase, partial [Bacteroidetes bacterium]|nr:bifunctional (p)ppGpp synthetase/guanosine-3',5'-bis(diphosphate) 3'-pyrophosphohydrolase [Bacteroidota bacterium]